MIAELIDEKIAPRLSGGRSVLNLIIRKLNYEWHKCVITAPEAE